MALHARNKWWKLQNVAAARRRPNCIRQAIYECFRSVSYRQLQKNVLWKSRHRFCFLFTVNPSVAFVEKKKPESLFPYFTRQCSRNLHGPPFSPGSVRIIDSSNETPFYIFIYSTKDDELVKAALKTFLLPEVYFLNHGLYGKYRILVQEVSTIQMRESIDYIK